MEADAESGREDGGAGTKARLEAALRVGLLLSLKAAFVHLCVGTDHLGPFLLPQELNVVTDTGSACTLGAMLAVAPT